MAVFSGLALSLIMAAAWGVQLATGNSGWIDTTWSLGVGAVGAAAAVWPLSADWPHWRQICLALLAAAWCLRLAIHIARRTAAKTDDPRYRGLMAQWGDAARRRLFWFLQSQALVGVILVLSIALAAHNPDPALRLQDFLGLALLAVAILGEAIADRQLRIFAADPRNRGGVCDVGLWGWSRHPNYFFEWLSWLAYPVIAIDFAGYEPLGWLALAAPAWCIGCWCTSPAFRRWRPICCARAARRFAPISAAPAPSSRYR